MAAPLLEVDDLTPFVPNLDEAKAEAMIADALALAARVAPCIEDEDFEYAAAAKAVLRGAVLRWVDQGSGVGPALVAGIFQATPQAQPRRTLFYPSEISELQALCGGGRGRAFMIDTTPVCEVGS
ncbi:hypothetical protein [Mycolicibacterium septicum]|uniref:hypothetical protein n=1 Tax=Mycolicibacterium septicum TaxID=98668 RepID=UPI001AF0BCB1|nr:hypothetical protein [Mycolicibacterium septicum]QRY51734.1 hypothetical protein JVX95_30910 [Mycolicibacterium septicum]